MHGGADRLVYTNSIRRAFRCPMGAVSASTSGIGTAAILG